MRLDLKDCTVTVTNTRAYEIRVREGNLKWTQRRQWEVECELGALYGIREGDAIPMEVSLQCAFETIASAGTVCLVSDICTEGSRITVENDAACGKTVTYTFPNFYPSQMDGDFKESSLAVQGICFATQPTITIA